MSFCRRVTRLKQVEVDTVGIEYETTELPMPTDKRPTCLLRAPQELDFGQGGYDLAYALAQRCIALEAELAALRFGQIKPMIDNLSKPARPLDPDFHSH